MKTMRKILIVALIAAAAIGLCIFAAACGEEPAPELTGITVSGTYETEYVEGQTFDKTGMVVTAKYDDGTSKSVTGYTVDKTGALSVGDSKVTVSYTEGEVTKTAEIEITVAAKAITSVEVTKAPTKTEYIEGQTFDKTGMEVTAHYNDGTSVKVTDYTIDKTGALSVGDSKVTVTYGGKTAEVKITVKAKSVTGISLNTDGVKKDYYVGDAFVSDGLKVTAQYDNGTSGEVTGFTVSKPDMSSAGSKEITVTYEGKTAKFNITVTAVVLESIEVTKAPTKTEYIEGQTFDKAGMEVTAHYNDERKDKKVTDYTIDKTGALSVGDSKVTVTYGGKTAEVKITVKAKSVTGISLNTDGVKKDYYVGDAFVSDGLKVTAQYDNGTSGEVTGFTVSKPDMSSAGSKEITVTYEGKTAKFNINVQAVVITKLEITTEPKTDYVAGDTFDPAGMVVKATYNNGKVDEDFKDYDYDKKSALTADDTVVKITAGDVSVDLAITVKAELTSIEVKTDGITKKTYFDGDSFDYNGIVVIAHYGDDSSEEVSGYEVTVDPETLTAGVTSVTLTVSYGGKQQQAVVDGITVSSATLERIEVTTQPDKVDYREGETFESAGLVVTGHYSNDTSAPISGYTLSVENGGAFTGTGVITVTVTYNGAETEFTVNVHAYTGIVVSGEYKTDYNCGDAFVSDGLVVTAQYEGGAQYDKTLEAGEYTVSEGELSETNNKVTVTYNEKIAEITLNVTHKYEASVTKEPTYTEEGEKTFTCACGDSYTEPVPKLTLTAAIDEEYATSYENSKEFVIDTLGTIVSGGKTPNPEDNPPEGGIGYLDKSGCYVEYWFVTDEAGTFDLVWYVAGNKWVSDSQGGYNEGIDDLSKYMTWTVDGIDVGIAGIELPAGSGDNEWWNLKKVVVEGVKLGAGAHVVRMYNICDDTTGNAFPNVGSFTVYSSAEMSSVPQASRYDYNGFTSEKGHSITINASTVDRTNVGDDGAITAASAAGTGVEASKGVKLDADDKTGCFGGFDEVGRWIVYTFTLDEAGSVDINLAAAGSKWNSSTSSNDGLTDLGTNVRLTVDGMPVSLGGIGLPAGSGDNAWWNLYEIVAENIALDAGTHTVRMEVIAKGGLNIEDFTISSSSVITAGAQA